ncbi:MAG: alpha/beta hydrolase family protein [Polyangiaceae bacterium]|nr:alpha/beta hydrolase family protein [Polyangiaceae bacterium]
MLRAATRKAVGGAAAAVDRVATLAAYAATAGARRKSRSESLGHDERLAALAGIADEYPPEAPWFRPARPITPVSRAAGERPGGVRVADLTWPSDHWPAGRSVAERWRPGPSGLASVRLFEGRGEPGERPVAVLVHGYLGGNYSTEERVFPVAWLGRLGFDVALFTLPHHGLRADPRRRGAPPFPGSDPRMTNEGFLQAIGDLRDLVSWLGERGHPAVGALGMSLGGYTTALAATVEPTLAFAVPIIPLASLADFARDQGRLGRGEAQSGAQHAALDRAHRVVSPLHRAPVVAGDRILVVGAEADRITPLAHARRLAKHFGAPLETWHGGHLLQVGRAEKFRRIGRLLRELGLVRERR